MRDLAERLIAHEARESNSSGTRSQATFPVSETLRPPLAALVGNTGFDALLSRALVLAGKDVAWLRAVHVSADGSLQGLAEARVQVDHKTIAEGRVALLAQLLELLRAFIGENLTKQLMHEVWPKLLLKDLYFGDGGANESEK